MKLTITKVEHMHRGCRTEGCPVCSYVGRPTAERNARVTEFLKLRGLTVTAEGGASPWWHVAEGSRTCYAALRG